MDARALGDQGWGERGHKRKKTARSPLLQLCPIDCKRFETRGEEMKKNKSEMCKKDSCPLSPTLTACGAHEHVQVLLRQLALSGSHFSITVLLENESRLLFFYFLLFSFFFLLLLFHNPTDNTFSFSLCRIAISARKHHRLHRAKTGV